MGIDHVGIDDLSTAVCKLNGLCLQAGSIGGQVKVNSAYWKS